MPKPLVLQRPRCSRPYSTCCVPWAIASWTGQSVEEVCPDLAMLNRRGCSTEEVVAMLKASGLPLREIRYLSIGGREATAGTSITPRLRDIHPNQRGFAWINDKCSRHMVAFDGWLISCAYHARILYLHDTRWAGYRLEALILLT